MSEQPAQHEIIQGLRNGSQDAWNALCQMYSSRLWGYVSRLIGSDAEAVADVYQETMMAVARSGRSLEEDTRLWAWLSRIAHNQAALHWRQHFRSKVTAANLEQVASSADTEPTAVLAQAELVEAVRRLLADMNSEQVALLTAKYLDGQSIAEMTELFGGGHEAIRSRLARARTEFRTRYERLAGRQPIAGTSPARSNLPREGD